MSGDEDIDARRFEAVAQRARAPAALAAGDVEGAVTGAPAMCWRCGAVRRWTAPTTRGCSDGRRPGSNVLRWAVIEDRVDVELPQRA